MDALDACQGEPIRIFFRRDGADQSPATVAPQPIGKPQWIGVQFGSTRIRVVRPGSWAEAAGLQADDVITAINEVPVSSEGATLKALNQGGASGRNITVERDGASVTIAIPANGHAEPAEAVLAFHPGLVVNRAWPGYPADKAGIRQGDRIVSVDGNPVEDAIALSEHVAKAEGQSLMMVWLRDGKRRSARLTPQRRWWVELPWAYSQTTIRAGFFDACRLGTRKALQWIIRIYGTLRSLITGQVSARHLSGPIGIGYLTYTAARRGIGMLLYILGVLSVNLGIVNLLPVPVFDGGHLLFAAIEKVRGKAVSERVRGMAGYVGLAVILCIVVLTFWNDIRSLIFG